MTRFCLDTSAYSHFRRGEPRVVGHVDQASWIGVPSVVLGELWAGFLVGGRLDKNSDELAKFLAQPVVAVLQVDEDIARIYGEVFADLRVIGRPLPTNDIWIAATAVRVGATVLTFDEHFRAVSRVSSLVL